MTARPLEPHRTAMARRGPSVPLRQALAAGHIIGPVLDFGCGRGADVLCLRARGFIAIGFDPHEPFGFPMPTGKFATVMMTYVVNVLPPAERTLALRAAWDRVQPGGRLLVASRPRVDILDNARRRGWAQAFDGYLSGHGTFQVGLTQDELAMMLARLPGSASTIIVACPGAAMVLTRKPR